MNKGRQWPVTAFRTMPDGREICNSSTPGRREYQSRRDEAWDRDRGLCVLCGLFVPLESCTAEHIISRGMGGAKRDDRLSNLGVSHWYGNNSRGSMSYELYMQKPLEERKRLCRG